MQGSIFKLYSIGRASENKKRGSNTLNVLPVEVASGTDGEINFDPQLMTNSFTSLDGSTIEIDGIVARELECQWLPNEDNRLTSPDIRRDELIEIWRLGDTDQYYWRSMGLRNGLRALESVIFAWGASPDLGGHGLDLEKCYILAVSAHDKHFTIRTSKANGELYSYTFQINTKESSVYIADDNDNFIELDSKANRLQLKNVDGSFVKVEKRFIELSADEYIDLKVKDSSLRMTPDSIAASTTNYNVDAKSNVSIKSSGGMSITAASDLTIKAPNVVAICDAWSMP